MLLSISLAATQTSQLANSANEQQLRFAKTANLSLVIPSLKPEGLNLAKGLLKEALFP